MRELGWTPVRVRDLTRGGYKEQVRGYCRDARNGQADRPGKGDNVTRSHTSRVILCHLIVSPL
jgi:hypothetical protein